MESKHPGIKMNLAHKLEKMSDLLNDSLTLFFSGFYKGKVQLCDEADQKTKELRTLLEQFQKESSEISASKKEAVSAATILSHCQKIVSDLIRLNSLTRSKNSEEILFTEKAVMELEELFRGLKNLCAHLNNAILTRNDLLIDSLLKEKKKYKQLCRKFAQEHEKRLLQGICIPRSSSLYLSMLDSTEDILWHLQLILEELTK